jgi:hypothetical protein
MYWRSYENLTKDQQHRYNKFVYKAYARNGINQIPTINKIKFGDSSEPVDDIVLSDGIRLSFGISWANESNDRILQNYDEEIEQYNKDKKEHEEYELRQSLKTEQERNNELRQLIIKFANAVKYVTPVIDYGELLGTISNCNNNIK